MKLSIALCTCNGMPYLSHMMESILNQELLPDEIIVGDDCSTDGTLPYLDQMAMEHKVTIQIIKHRERLGARKNFEKTICACSGDIIFLADQDDAWLPFKTKIIHQYFEEHPAVSAVFSDARIMNAAGFLTGENLWKSFGFTTSGCRTNEPEQFLLYQLLNPSLVTGATMALRRNRLQNSIPLFTPQHYWHDYWFGLYFSATSQLHAIDEPLMNYRQHEKQQTLAGLPDRETALNYQLAWRGGSGTENMGQSLLNHLAHAYTRFKLFEPELKKRGLDKKKINITGNLILEKLSVHKEKVLRQLPLPQRKWKMLKHWLKGGEYLRIGLSDLFRI